MKIVLRFKSGSQIEFNFQRAAGVSEDEVLAQIRSEVLIEVEVHGKRARIVEEDEVLQFRLKDRRVAGMKRRIGLATPNFSGYARRFGPYDRRIPERRA